MPKKKPAYLLVNFGGPRNLSEIEPFLKSLLTDRDVIRTRLPHFAQKIVFERIAKKRALAIQKDYELIGGSSPIFDDTLAVAEMLERKFESARVLAFHRYLPSTHAQFLKEIRELDAEEIIVFPLFPQFTYATTGSIARFFYEQLPLEILNKMSWVKSYATHSSFVGLFQKNIREFLQLNELIEEKTILLFSAHGLPQNFIDTGDFYQNECQSSFEKIMEAFPKMTGRLCFQSKFGPEEWIRPYTNDVCEQIAMIGSNKENVLFVPLSFTSDHIETLFEVEEQYMPIIREQGLNAFRLPAFNRRPDWINAIESIMKDFNPVHTSMLIRWDNRDS